jgi:hypothetical protein
VAVEGERGGGGSQVGGGHWTKCHARAGKGDGRHASCSLYVLSGLKAARLQGAQLSGASCRTVQDGIVLRDCILDTSSRSQH